MPKTAQAPSGPQIGSKTRIWGMQEIASAAFSGQSPLPYWEANLARVQSNLNDAAALHDLALIMQAFRLPGDAMNVLLGAVSLQKDYCVVHGNGTGLRLLALVTPGDFMANIPVDFLLRHSNCVLWLHYVDAETTSLAQLPEHDVAIMAIGEAPQHTAVLNRLAALLPTLKTPVMNAAPQMIQRLTRDGVSQMLAQEPSILVPAQHRISRKALEPAASGQAPLDDLRPGLGFPLVIRPVGSHAGEGLARIASAPDLADYLAARPDDTFYLAPFIDYRGPDGLYNKQRVVLIDGKPFPSHMAISEDWMVHYLSAGMLLSAEKRATEARWMEQFDSDYAVRHRRAFAALHRSVGLDYFGFDCAEMPDGRLLIFEVDVAMIVHDMDDEALFPYKKAAMRRLFDAFLAAARSKSPPAKADAA